LEWIGVKYLERERAVLDSFLPGLDAKLAELSLSQLESKDGPAIEIFRASGGPGLLVPKMFGGLEATPADAICIQRALGARSPSLAVATAMHHFTVAGLLEVMRVEHGFEGTVLEEIATHGKILASGFAEGIHNQGIFSPTMQARRHGEMLLLSGEKKPCSLSRSMDLLTVSLFIEPDDGSSPEYAVAVLPADTPGIEVVPFWSAGVLEGTQSDAVVLTDVVVDPRLVVTSGPGPSCDFGGGQVPACIWFELLITSAYLGIASALTERLLSSGADGLDLQAVALTDTEAAMASLDSMARRVAEKECELLPTVLACRYACQDAIGRAVSAAVEQLGGLNFLSSDEVNYLASSSRALAFHPPARLRTAHAVANAYRGHDFVID
jgi:alkylation response protein AidB-like acyl-CoA dehydrogenase